MNYYSQINQDRYFIENINNNKQHGVFIDIGAHDGIVNSNTYALEKYLNWSGYCVEANQKIYKTLRQNRQCECILGAAWNKNTYVTFEAPAATMKNKNNIIASELGRVDHQDVDKYFNNWFEDSEKQIVEAFRISDKISLPKQIDFLSLDVEGAEIQVLEGIDLNAVNISFMTIEHGNRENRINEIEKFLIKYKYEIHRVNGHDVEFIKTM